MAIGESVTNERMSGTLSVDRHKIIFTPDEDQKPIVFDIHTLVLEMTGSNGKMVFITDPDHNPETTITTRDWKILQDPLLCELPKVKALCQQKSLKNIVTGIAIAIAILFVGLIPTAWGLVTEASPYLIPVEAEEKLGSFLIQYVHNDKTIIEHPKALALLEEVCKPLVDHAQTMGHSINIVVAEDSKVNAYAFPGGYIILNSGLITKTKNVEELAGVIAHEIGHITNRHHLKSLVSEIGITTLLALVFQDFASVAEALYLGHRFSQLSFSRENEHEADAAAIKTLEKSGYSPTGIRSFLENLKNMDDSKLRLPAIFSTHPSLEHRIEYLKKHISKTIHIDNSKNQHAFEELKKQF
jgi:predicted Zn-dependent protease